MLSPRIKNLEARTEIQKKLNEDVLVLEREKFELLKKIKNYEDKDSQNETEKRRILNRQKVYKENLKTMEDKIKEYRTERKELQKKIIYILQHFSKLLNNTSTINQTFLSAFGNMMQNLAVGQPWDSSQIEVFQPGMIIDDMFEYIDTLKIEKIDFNKVKNSIQKRLQGQDKIKQKFDALNNMYKGLQSRFQLLKGDISRDDFNEILDQFESHKQLLIENSSLLSRKSHNDSIDLNNHSFLDSSLNHSAMSSILDASTIRSGMINLNKTFNLKESLKDDNKDLLLLCEDLGDQNDDMDLKIKMANKRTNKLKREVERIRNVLVSKKNDLKQVEEKGKNFEDEFEAILTQLEGKVFKNNYF